MLGKSIKYELKSTARIFLPFYLAIIILSVINRLFFIVFDSVDFLLIPRFITMILYFCILIGTFVLAGIVMIQRFYKSLLGEEGYLSMTLPVSMGTHITCKCIVATMWILATIVIALLSIFVLIPDYSFIGEIGEIMRQASAMVYEQTGLSLSLIILQLFIMFITAIPCEILLIYLSISIGQLSNKHRLLTSFGAYLAITTALQMIFMAVLLIFGNITINSDVVSIMIGTNDVTPMGRWYEDLAIVVPVLFWVAIVVQIVMIAGYFFATRYFLKNKLNLE